MELETGFRMRARTARVKGQLPHFDCDNSLGHERDPAGRGGLRGGPKLSSIHSTGRSRVAPQEGVYVIEIFGMSAGVLIMNGFRLVFRAAHRAFRELDESYFSSVAHAEREVHLTWTRFQHRSCANNTIRQPRPVSF